MVSSNSYDADYYKSYCPTGNGCLPSPSPSPSPSPAFTPSSVPSTPGGSAQWLLSPAHHPNRVRCELLDPPVDETRAGHPSDLELWSKSYYRRWLYGSTCQRFNMIFLVVLLTLMIACIVLSFVVSGIEGKTWFICIQAAIDLLIAAEVACRISFLGMAYFESKLNCFDFLIVLLCIVATALEHIPHILNTNEDTDSDSVLLGMRIARDVVRCVRVVVTMRLLQSSVVDIDLENNPSGLFSRQSIEGVDFGPHSLSTVTVGNIQ